MLIFNGKLIEKDKAQISVFDKGLLLGFGLFETLRLSKGKVIALKKHWQRLQSSALKLELILPLTFEMLVSAISTLVQSQKLINAGLRLTVSFGEGPRGLVFKSNQKAHYFLEYFDLPSASIAPLKLCWSSILANPSDPVSSLKSLSYLTHAFVKKEAQNLGFDDALQLTFDGFITESSCANIFIIKEGKLFTPPLSEGIIAGITRERIIDCCERESISCVEQRLSQLDIEQSDGAFLCNALRGLMPISSIGAISFTSSTLITRLKKQLENKWR